MCGESVTGAKMRLLGVRVAMQATGEGATGLLVHDLGASGV